MHSNEFVKEKGNCFDEVDGEPGPPNAKFLLPGPYCDIIEAPALPMADWTAKFSV